MKLAFLLLVVLAVIIIAGCTSGTNTQSSSNQTVVNEGGESLDNFNSMLIEENSSIEIGDLI